jgi:hypothetical protein
MFLCELSFGGWSSPDHHWPQVTAVLDNIWPTIRFYVTDMTTGYSTDAAGRYRVAYLFSVPIPIPSVMDTGQHCDRHVLADGTLTTYSFR